MNAASADRMSWQLINYATGVYSMTNPKTMTTTWWTTSMTTSMTMTMKMGYSGRFQYARKGRRFAGIEG
jgi:hypothetical protein